MRGSLWWQQRFVVSPGRLCCAVSACVLAAAAHAQPSRELTGRITWEGLYFPQDAAPGVERTSAPSITTLTLNGTAHGSAGALQWSANARPRLTATRSDDPRRGFRWDELYLQLNAGRFEVKAGFLQEHWGVLETRQLVDLVNTYDNLDGLIPEKKLPQRAAKLGARLGVGQLDLYHFLSDFEPLRFYAVPARFTPYRVEPMPEYIEGADPSRPGQAARYWVAGDDLDIGISFFRGIDRQPRFRQTATGWAAQYAQVRQLGVDATWVTHRTTLKLEALRTRSANREANGWRRSVGVEYAFPRALGISDLSLVAEYHHDTVGAAASQSIFDRKLLLAARVEANDLHKSSAFVGWMEDLRTRGNRLLMLRFDLGLTDDTRLGLGATLPHAAPDDPQWQANKRDGSVKLELSHAFSL